MLSWTFLQRCEGLGRRAPCGVRVPVVYTLACYFGVTRVLALSSCLWQHRFRGARYQPVYEVCVAVRMVSGAPFPMQQNVMRRFGVCATPPSPRLPHRPRRSSAPLTAKFRRASSSCATCHLVRGLRESRQGSCLTTSPARPADCDESVLRPIMAPYGEIVEASVLRLAHELLASLRNPPILDCTADGGS
jgi:hypothetical protein